MLRSVQVPVQTEGELVELMQQGIAKRTVARTGMNAASSRSHCLVMLAVEKHCPNGSVGHGKLCLVDLAGALLTQFLLQHETCMLAFVIFIVTSQQIQSKRPPLLRMSFSCPTSVPSRLLT